MSAPWEVNVLNGITTSFPCESLAHGHSVRYLRADLTCADCLWLNYAECPHNNGACTGLAACMAFTPKEAK